jgi:hypothetical protein
MILCDICSDRKESRMKEWVENIDYETIWTGELQDKKGRIALVTLKFEMKEWLDGDLINSLVIRNENFYNNIKNIITLLRNMDTVYKNFMNDGSLKMFENFREDNKELINKFLVFVLIKELRAHMLEFVIVKI